MDRTSGLKECPRCGLRNRHGASQCDFCGWDFKEASDDWMGKVDDLEKLSKEASAEEIDHTTVSKIELTMTKPADLPVPERPQEVPEAVEDYSTGVPEENGDVLAQAVESPPVQAEEIEATPLTEEAPVLDDMEESVVPEQEGEEATHLPEETTGSPTETPIEETDFRSEEAISSDSNLNKTYVMIGIGAGIYITDLVLTTLHLIDKTLGWAAIIIASALIALSVVRLLPGSRPREEGEEEVFLCPICHEVVGENDPRCPSCGASFKETMAVE